VIDRSRRAELLGELEPCPAVTAWLQRVAAEPGHVAIT
jgi:hypothetical protein